VDAHFAVSLQIHTSAAHAREEWPDQFMNGRRWSTPRLQTAGRKGRNRHAAWRGRLAASAAAPRRARPHRPRPARQGLEDGAAADPRARRFRAGGDAAPPTQMLNPDALPNAFPTTAPAARSTAASATGARSTARRRTSSVRQNAEPERGARRRPPGRRGRARPASEGEEGLAPRTPAVCWRTTWTSAASTASAAPSMV
jgi:hypothetical protein